MNNMNKRTKVDLGILIIIAILVAFGPILVTRIARHVFKPKKPIVQNVVLKIKAQGTISIMDNKTILTTPSKINNYLLEGKVVNQLTKFVGKKQAIFVFGDLKFSNPKNINNTKITSNIEVFQFDTKDFYPATMSPDEIVQNIEFRKQVLSKLGFKESWMDVISGKLIIGTCIINGKPAPCLLVKDKRGEVYILSNRGNVIKAPFEKFLQFKSLDMDVVVVGRLALPDQGVILPNYPNIMTFLVSGLYNSDLSKFKVEEP